MVISKHRNDVSKSPAVEAQQLFPGHQEFFFEFLKSTENYSFSNHLRNRVSQILLDLSAEGPRNLGDIEKRLLNMQMFGRFLGYLVFSVNWHDGVEMDLSGSNIVKPPLAGGWLQQLVSLGLPLNQLLCDAWKKGHTAMVVPWVTELLKMAKWDPFSQGSRKYRELLADLRFIQEQTMASSNDAVSNLFFGPTKQLVSFYLETFFYETVGFSRLTSLPKGSLESSKPSESPDDSTILDRKVIGFSGIILFASNPHVEELNGLIARLSSSSGGMKSPTKARKLRPSIVSSSVTSSVVTNLFQESPTEIGLPVSPLKPLTSKLGNEASTLSLTNGASTKNIQSKLADAFFHQHRELREVCEFAVNKVLVAVSKELPDRITKLFDETDKENWENESIFKELKQKASVSSLTFLHNRLRGGVRGSLLVLGPSALDSKLLDIAVSLAAASGMQIGQPIIDSVVGAECNKILEWSRNNQQKQRNPAKTTAPKFRFEEVIEAMTTFLQNNRNDFHKDDQVRNDICWLQRKVEGWRSSDVDCNSIPPEADIHTFFQLLLEMDKLSPRLLNWCLTFEDPVECWLVLSPFLESCSWLASSSRHGMRGLMNELRSNPQLLPNIFRCGLLAESSTLHGIDLNIFFRSMVESRLVPLELLKHSMSLYVDGLELEQCTRLHRLMRNLETQVQCGD